MPQKIQPVGLAGRREAISAPTVGNASESTPVSTAKLGPSLGMNREGTSAVRKSSKSASAVSPTHAAHADQANQAATRVLIPPTPRPCSLVPSVTTPLYRTTVSKVLRGQYCGPREQTSENSSSNHLGE